MYHNSVCCSSVRHIRVQAYGECRSRCPNQGHKFDPLSLYGGLHGLSFDPTNTHALLCAVNALPSTQEPRRCSLQTSCADSPRLSSPCSSSKSSNSSASLTTPSTSTPLPCPCPASGPGQPIPVAEAVQETCSSGSNTSSSQENSSQGISQQGSSKGSVQVQGVIVGTSSKGSVQAQGVGVGTASKGSEKNGLTWIDWGWPGTHTPCPFNQRHTVDDVLIRPERVGLMITKTMREANTDPWLRNIFLPCTWGLWIRNP